MTKSNNADLFLLFLSTFHALASFWMFFMYDNVMLTLRDFNTGG